MLEALNNQLKQQLARLQEVLEQRTERERVLLIVAILSLLGTGAYYTVFLPAQERIEAAQNGIATERKDIAAARKRIAELEERLAEDPNEHLRDDIAELERQLAEQKERVEAELPEFINPQHMRRVLEGLLMDTPGARLIRLERLPTETLFAEQEGEVEVAIYQHPVRLEIEADYASATAYLQSLEELPWEFVWQVLDYKVVDYPRARITLRVNTISGLEEWLGV